MLPQARKYQLTIRHLPDETLVYDRERHKAHCLNATAALIWRHCDGQTSTDELARLVAETLGVPARPRSLLCAGAVGPPSLTGCGARTAIAWRPRFPPRSAQVPRPCRGRTAHRHDHRNPGRRAVAVRFHYCGSSARTGESVRAGERIHFRRANENQYSCSPAKGRTATPYSLPDPGTKLFGRDFGTGGDVLRGFRRVPELRRERVSAAERNGD